MYLKCLRQLPEACGCEAGRVSRCSDQHLGVVWQETFHSQGSSVNSTGLLLLRNCPVVCLFEHVFN